MRAHRNISLISKDFFGRVIVPEEPAAEAHSEDTQPETSTTPHRKVWFRFQEVRWAVRCLSLTADLLHHNAGFLQRCTTQC